VHGDVPYGVFGSSREALASLGEDEGQVVVAPYSAISADLHDGRLRALPWPAADGRAPRAWLAILAPGGLRASEIAALRAQARGLCAGATWARLLRVDGLRPVSPGTKLRSFVPEAIREAARLQSVAARVLRDYG
jgi:hypothetical protein